MIKLNQNETVVTLPLSFIYDLGKSIRPLNFEFRPLPSGSKVYLEALLCDKTSKEIFTVIDLYPLNGTVKRRKFNITDYVRGVHIQELKKHFDFLNKEEFKINHARCIVIDFKDKDKRYHCLESILDTENHFAAFFRGDGLGKKNKQAEIYSLMKTCRVDFFIHEGSLKCELLKNLFLAEESKFFQESEDGSKLLCQACEVIMNGFKQGFEVVVNGYSLIPNKFISLINNSLNVREDDFYKDITLPPIRLMTLYPSVYKELYSDNSGYFRLVKKIFHATHGDEDGITKIEM